MRNFLVGCTAILVCRLLAAWIFPTFDDAFITYRYATNLVSGNGLVYNAGEKVLGTTAPLFAIISCIPFLIHLPVQKFFVIFNCVCDCCSLFIVYKYIFKQSKLSFFLIAFFFAIDPVINRVSIGGMEADLFLMLSLSGLALYTAGKKTYAFLLLAALYFLRPEGVILVIILFCYDLYSTRRLSIKLYFFVSLVITLPILLIYAYYGQALPQSVIAKNTMGRETMLHLIKNIFFPDALFYVFVPLAIYGFIHQFAKNKFALLMGAWAFSFGMAYLIRGPFIWSWYPFSIEFSILVFASMATASLLEKIAPVLAVARNVYVYLLSLTAITVMTGIAIYEGRSGVEANVYKQLQTDFSSNDDIKKKIIFADDIGAIGFFTKAYMYDDLALITTRALKYKTTIARIINSNADYLFIYSDPVYINLITSDPQIGKKYTFYKRYSIHGETAAPGKESGPGVRNYVQDYVLFKKD
jgi:hypothetical protein